MERKPIFYSFLRCLWTISLLVLFCGVTFPQESFSKPAQITFYDQSIAASYFQLSFKNYGLSFIETSRIKKTNPTPNVGHISLNRFIASDKPQYTHTVNELDIIFQSHLHTAFLLLDMPPPSVWFYV